MNMSLTPMARMLVCGGCLALPCLAGVTNITSGGFAHNTLTEAIDWANYGDTLLVSMGTYHEHLTIVQKSLTFLGGYAANFSQRTNDPSLTVVDAGTNASVLHVANYCSVVLDCMTLTNGAADKGGGICVAHGLGPLHTVAVHMRTSVIACCTATCGGGIYVGSNSIVTLADTAVAGCTAAQGGGICATGQQVNVVLHGARTVLRGNTATEGGAVWAVGVSIAICSNASVRGNNAGERGGGAYLAQSLLVVDEHAALLGNHAARSGGAIMVTNGTVVVRNGATIGDVAGSVSNHAADAGGGICAEWSSVEVHGAFVPPPAGPPCVFINNQATYGGACFFNIISDSRVRDALIVSNRATQTGGGVYATSGGHSYLCNCVVARNTAPRGAGVAAGLSTRWHADYCTIAHNSSAGVDWYAGVAGLTNCVVWGNVGTQITAGASVSFCDVEGGYPGNGNLATDPQFRNPGALDWSLALGSPCIDTAVNCGVTLDCRGALRPMGCGYDIGAYELDPRPVLGVTPTTLDFGAVQVGGATSLPLLIESQGNGWLTGTIDSVPVPIFSAACYAYAVPPNAATNVLFAFAPPIVYAWTQTVRFVSNGGVADAVLLGTGVPEPAGLGLLGLFMIYNVQITIWRKRQKGH